MDYTQKIQDIINEALKEVKIKRNTLLKQQDASFKDLETVINKMNDVINNEKKLIYITDDDLDIINKFITEKNKNVLIAYREFLKNNSLVFDQQFVLNLRMICQEAINSFNEYKIENQGLNNEVIKLDELNKKLNDLKSKLINYNITSQDLDLFVDLFKEFKVPISVQLDFIIFISNQYMKNVDIDVLSEQQIEEQDVGIAEEILVQLFLEYNYNFYDLNAQNQSRLKKEGNLNNIKQIFEILNENSINLNSPITIFKTKSNQITEILINSNAQMILELIKALQAVNLEKIHFLSLIKSPSIFISRTVPYTRKRPSSTDGNYSINKYGCNEDFIANLKLLKQKYDQISDIDQFHRVYEKCISMLKKPNTQVLNTIKVYELYNISPADYLNALSGLNSIKQADTFDLAIELNCLDYVTDNMSKAMLKVDDKIFRNIALAQKKGYKDEDIFRYVNKNTLFGVKYCKILNETKIDAYVGNSTFEKFTLDKNFSEQDKLIFNQIEKMIEDSNNFDISISQSEVDNDKSNSLLNQLEIFASTENPYVYNIRGIRISKMKVFRLYNTLKQNNIIINEKILLYILTRNSYLTQFEFDELYDEINNLLQKEKKI